MNTTRNTLIDLNTRLIIKQLHFAILEAKNKNKNSLELIILEIILTLKEYDLCKIGLFLSQICTEYEICIKWNEKENEEQHLVKMHFYSKENTDLLKLLENQNVLDCIYKLGKNIKNDEV